jgi:hypothetical protein
LRQRTGFGSAQIDQDLTCLYYSGAITTTRSKAAVQADRDSAPPSSGADMQSLLQAQRDAQTDVTAPAQLSRLTVGAEQRAA